METICQSQSEIEAKFRKFSLITAILYRRNSCQGIRWKSKNIAIVYMALKSSSKKTWK